MGARYHNTVLMNDHGGNNGYVLATELAGVSTIARADVNPAGGYMYARGDASGSYTSNAWTNAGYPNNNARVFVRDFLYIPEADVVAFGDRLSYSDATVSPTKWIARFTGAPTVSGQRIVSQYAGQKIVHDVVVPERAALTTVNEVQEYPVLDDFLTRPYFRVETVSGTRTAEEWSLQIIQLGDAGLAPDTITRLTTDRINVAQVGGRFVIGVVKDAEARSEMTYRYSGTPTHYLMGFEPNTAYDVESNGGIVTIKPGGGSVRSNSAGMIVLNPTRRQASSGRTAPPPPAKLSINR
jgi:hypothetical protein